MTHQPAKTPMFPMASRKVTYLRLSVTPACNYRCAFCSPQGSVLTRQTNGDRPVLRPQQFVRICRILARLGVDKVRLTGGEPLLRKDIAWIAESVRSITQIRSVAITTNGCFLLERVQALASAGVETVNVNLPSLKHERYTELTGKDLLDHVLEGIHASVDLGLQVKVNVVAFGRAFFDEVDDFVSLACKLPLEVRFIEYMPLCHDKYTSHDYVPLEGLERELAQKYSLGLAPRKGQVARVYVGPGLRGRVGFILAMSHPFCQDCNRIRVTASGFVRPCLFLKQGLDLAPLLESHPDDRTIAAKIAHVLSLKPEVHPMNEGPWIRETGG